MDEKKYAITNGGEFVRTSDILLRIPTEADMDGMFELFLIENSDEEDRYNTEDGKALWKRLYYQLYTNEKSDYLYLSMIDHKSNKFLGRFTMQEYGSVAPEIGIYLLAEHQGKGIAEKAIRAYLEKVRELRDVPYFTATIDKDNLYSQKMISKLNSEQVMMIKDSYCYKIYTDL